jgi:hypothetical protein
MAGPHQPNLAREWRDRIERCWLCGIRLPTAQMVPDGSSACTDVRWYCRDLRACTGRWTTAARPRSDGPGRAVSDRGSVRPEPADGAGIDVAEERGRVSVHRQGAGGA